MKRKMETRKRMMRRKTEMETEPEKEPEMESEREMMMEMMETKTETGKRKRKMAMEKDNDKKRGGRRPGAGRPRGDSRMISFRAPGRLAEQLDSIGNRTEFIRNALEKAVRKNEASAVRKSEAETALNMIPAEKTRSFSLPYFDIRVVAGFPVPLDNDERSQDIDILTMLCPHPEASYLIRVSGNSMIDAGLLDGDIVIVDKSNRNPSPHEIAMCELNGEYTLKHFVPEDGQGWLVPANPDYPRIPVTRDDDFSVWGTVTYIIQKAREQ